MLDQQLYKHRVTNIAGKKEDAILAELLTSIEENIGDKMTKRETRHLFTLIAEIIQNIQKYAIVDKDNFFEIGYDEDQNVVITCKNFASKFHADNIEKINNEITGINKSELEIKYNALLAKSKPENPSGGLGVMYLRNNCLSYRYKVDKVDEDIYSVGLKILY